MCTFWTLCSHVCELDLSWKVLENEFCESWKTPEFGLCKSWKIVFLLSVRTTLILSVSQCQYFVIVSVNVCLWHLEVVYFQNRLSSRTLSRDCPAVAGVCVS